MDDLTYLNFDLSSFHQGNKYRVRVDSPGGQASADFILPFSGKEISSFLARFGNEFDRPPPDAVKSFGGRLYIAVFADQILACLVRSQDEADRQKKGLRIRLNLSNAPELGRLPWEFLYDPSLNRFLGVSKITPIVRYLDLPERIRSLEVEPPLHVLVLISSPTDQPPLNVDREWDRMRIDLGDLEESKKLVLERMDKPTLFDLQDRLRGGPVHILHFIGHGVFDEESKDGVLLFERENRRGDPVSGGKLGTLLNDQPSLRLVILNACQGAIASTTDSFSGVAQDLVQQGIPAVIGMQFEIGEEAAVTFSQNFYKSISDNYPVDGALAEARKAINSTRSALEWATPVLYMRAGDGRLFGAAAKPAPPAPVAAQPAPVAVPIPAAVPARSRLPAWLAIGKGKAEAERLAKEKAEAARLAKEKAERLAEEAEAERLAKEKAERLAQEKAERLAQEIAEKEKRARIDSLLNKAQDAERRGDWSAAIQAYESIQVLDPSESINTQLANAQKQHNLSEEKAEAERLAKEKAEAKRLAKEKAERLAQEKAEAERLAKEKAEKEKRAQIDSLLNKAQDAERRGDWSAAIQAYESIQALDPSESINTQLANAQKQHNLSEEKAEAERLAKEKAEAKRLAKEKAERLAKEKAEAERLAKEKADAESQELEKSLAAMYQVGLDLTKERRWEEALESLSRTEKVRSSYRDVGALIAQAQSEIKKQKEEKEKRARIDSLLNKAQDAERRGDWSAAIQAYESIQALDPSESINTQLANAQKQHKLSEQQAHVREQTVTPTPAEPQTSRVSYLDFDITIGAGSGLEYEVTVHSVAGEAHATMEFPFDKDALETSLVKIQNALLSSAIPLRRISAPAASAVEGFGTRLFNSLIVGDIRSRYDESLKEAEHKNKGLRIKLRTASPELASLPWEFLYDTRKANYVCLSIHTPVVRYLEITQPGENLPPPPLTVEGPLHILGMIASPKNLGGLNVDDEKERVEKAVKKLTERGLVKVTWVSGPTWRDLQSAMRNGPWHIFHFIGHGDFDEKKDEGQLAFEKEHGTSENEHGTAQLLTATEVGRLLTDHRSLRLVLLNACDGAKGSNRDVYSSTASILVRMGIPAVLAMQYEISDEAAVEFSRSFYEAIADGMPVDAAATETRKALSMGGGFEWGTPALYLRAADGVLFQGKESSGG